MTDPGRRLTSWKAIAAYLGREVRTVMRWEKDRGLPIHRGPDGRSGVVFADKDELDAWTRGHKAEPESALPEPASSLPVARTAIGHWRVAAAAAGILTIAVGLGGWRVRVSGADDQPASVDMTDRAVIARHADGSEKWRHEFAERVTPLLQRMGLPTEPLAGDGLLAATSESTHDATKLTRGGQLLWFDSAGSIRRTFSFDDRLTFGARAYSAPWSLTDYQVDGAGDQRRIAISAHHYDWWPALVTILDSRWHRRATFVHAGWIEQVRWLPGARLAVAGFSNLKDGGMIALLDSNDIGGQAPSPSGSEFECAGCGSGRPVRYVVMPRSEVNRVSAAPFNRASLIVWTGALAVRTMELPPGPGGVAPANAVYEFNSQLDLVHAAYSDRYWDVHRELERTGKLTHARERCPEREGPRQVEIWEPATGWRVQTVNRLMASRRP
jgi:hypothetical protein